MYTDAIYRAFLLRMTDAETEAAIEDGILDGSIDTGYLRQIEEELVDDYVFGRLSQEERNHFNAEFLSAASRVGKVEFANALKQYAKLHASTARRWLPWSGPWKFAPTPWTRTLAGSLACALLAVAWLEKRNLSLRHELAQSKLDNNEQRHTIASMLQAERREAGQAVASHPQTANETGSPTVRKPAQGSTGRSLAMASGALDRAETPFIRLSRSVNRALGLPPPVLQFGGSANDATFEVDLGFNPRGPMREVLLNSEEKEIWNRQIPDSDVVARNGVITIKLPTVLFSEKHYWLRIEAGRQITYPFDVKRERVQ